jgi:hypothetical protein
MAVEDKTAALSAVPDKRRSREQVLQDIKVAIAQARNYGREERSRGSNPYEADQGLPLRGDVWGSKRRPA